MTTVAGWAATILIVCLAFFIVGMFLVSGRRR